MIAVDGNHRHPGVLQALEAILSLEQGQRLYGCFVKEVAGDDHSIHTPVQGQRDRVGKSAAKVVVPLLKVVLLVAKMNIGEMQKPHDSCSPGCTAPNPCLPQE